MQARVVQVLPELLKYLCDEIMVLDLNDAMVNIKSCKAIVFTRVF